MVAGDLVNTASRIQSVAEPGTVLVGESTKRAAEAAIVFENAGEHVLKGKAEPVQLWQAVRVIGLRGGMLKQSGLEPPFVGRDRELRLVKELFHASAEDRRGHLVSVVGIGGIGKSRLVWEFEKYIDGLAPARLLERRPVPRLRRRRRVLGARRDGARARRDPRGRGGRGRAREAAGLRRGAPLRPAGAPLRRAPARAPPRPRGGLDRRPGEPLRRRTHVLRADRASRGRWCSSSRTSTGRTARSSTSSSTSSNGRARCPCSSSRLRGRSSSTAGRPGGRAAQLHLHLSGAALARLDGGAPDRPGAGAARRAAGRASWSGRRGFPSTRSRRCGCSSTAACSSGRERRTG